MILIIPAAGLGSRFAERGYTTKKPLLPLKDGTPMIQSVITDCRRAYPDIERVLIGVQRTDADAVRSAVGPEPELILFDGVTAGAAQTVLTILASVHEDTPVVVANSDQKFDSPSAPLPRGLEHGVCFTAGPDTSSKWSFLTEEGAIIEKPETIPHGAVKTIGVYAWGSSNRLRTDIVKMIASNERHGPNQEFYLAPVMNRLKSIEPFEVDAFTALGTPEDYEDYLDLSL